MTQRSPKGSFPFTWETPGGKVESGEGFDTALERELSEELGVVARVQSGGPFPLRYVDIDPPICKVPRRIRFLLADIIQGTPRPLVAVDLQWFTAAELESLKMTPANEARRKELVTLVRGESNAFTKD